MVVLAIPVHRFLELDPRLLAGKLVIDAMNYWPASDGILSDLEQGGSRWTSAGSLTGRCCAPSNCWAPRSPPK
jgi:hypothetical protein